MALPLISTLAAAVGPLPASISGRWSGVVWGTPSGGNYGYPLPDFLVASTPDAEGNMYMRHQYQAQLMRVQGTNMQYCFNYDNPDAPVTGADEAPFTLVNVSKTDDGSDHIRFCWRGRRLPSHPTGCTGCDCAVWDMVIEPDGQHITSTFQQSPPVVHLGVRLTRTGDAPPAINITQGWDCKFDNYTGHPNLTTRCPFTAPAPRPLRKLPSSPFPVPKRVEATGDVTTNCVKIATAGVQGCRLVTLEWTPSQLPCMPCDVRFKMGMNKEVPKTCYNYNASGAQYLGIGFKETYAAYYGHDRVGEIANYWGMNTDLSDRNSSALTELSGLIVVAYLPPSGDGSACIREMRADAYVGSLVDVSEKTIINPSVSEELGRISLEFTVNFHAGATAEDLKITGEFGNQRVMWSAGNLGAPTGGQCTEALGYHEGERTVASLNFPGYGTPCI